MEVAAITELSGEFRTPRNTLQEAPNSIHSDSVAERLGFKGGLVTGRVHLDQFVPQILTAYGDQWFERGTISLYFTQATTDGELVRTFLSWGDDRSNIRMENEAGAIICAGTADADPNDQDTEFRRRMAQQPAAKEGELRILRGLAIGETHENIVTRVTNETLEATLQVITEALPRYGEHRQLPPSQIMGMSKMVEPALLTNAAPSVGMYGALEVRNLKGPLYADRDYVARSKVLKLTQSPKTEAAWWDITLADPESGDDVAMLGLLGRYMKASSPLWTG